MDLSLILNPWHDESPQRHIKVETPSIDRANNLFYRLPQGMTTFPPNTLATMDMDVDSSTIETVPSSTPSTSTDDYSSYNDGELSSGDDEVMASTLFVDGPRKYLEAARDEHDENFDDDTLSLSSEQSMKEEPEFTPEAENSRCQYMRSCNTGSNDYRKVVSHIFGRNKKCTTQIPEECWIEYCRKHYQRTRYRTTKAQSKQYFNVQFDILLRQLTRLERWGEVRSWEIAIRKKERDALKREDYEMIRHQSSLGGVNQAVWNRVHQCKERMLMPYLGKNKTYSDVRRFLDFIHREVERDTFPDMPGFELLPHIGAVAHPPKGESKELKASEDEHEMTSSKVRTPVSRQSQSLTRSSSALNRVSRPIAKARSKASEESEDDYEIIPSLATTTTSRKSPVLKRSSSTLNRISKPTLGKERAKKTRRLVQASERYIKVEDLDRPRVVAGSSKASTSSSCSPPHPRERALAYDSPVPKSSSSISPIESSSRSSTKDSTSSIAQRKKGIAHPRFPKVMTPARPRNTTAATTPSSSHLGFRPVNETRREVAYRPATPRTPPGNVSPTPHAPNQPWSGARIDTSRNVVLPRIPKRIGSKTVAREARR